jgi:hypothetical protein
LAKSLPTKSRAFQGTLKSSPYVGWFRHAPSSRDEYYQRQARKWLEEEVYLFLNSMPSKGKDGVRCLRELLDTSLPGGGNDGYGRKATPMGHSNTLMVLQKLTTWLMLPFQEDEMDQNSWNRKSLEQESHDSQVTLEDEESDEESKDDDEEDDVYSNYSASDEPSVGELDAYDRSPSSAFDIGISSQAEAYYAHQVTNELTVNPDDHTTVLPSPSASRLDYVITQMDIVRMHRNASRHLDVESIYKLPTMTYRAPNVEMPKVTRTDKSAGWSWMLIPADKSHDEDDSSLILEEAGSELPSTSKQPNTCVICLESFVEGDRLRVLPCDHSFHVGCIDRWLSGSCSFDDCHTSGCPTCKKQADEGLGMSNLDGSVPSWAFAQLGRSLAREALT